MFLASRCIAKYVMRIGDASSSRMSTLPVFAFPSMLTFCANDSASLKQVITLYNPYDFPLNFQVLSTCPDKYVVGNPSGSLKARCCIDIVVKHVKVERSSFNRQDKFRLQLHEPGQSQVVGKKDIPAVLLENALPTTFERDEFKRIPAADSSIASAASATSSAAQQTHPFPSSSALHRKSNSSGGSPSALVVCVAALCITALSLPTQGESGSSRSSSFVPEYLHLSVSQKLVAAYVLGLVTMVLLRPS